MELFLHKLDPRTKLIILPVFSVLVFVVDKLPAAAGLMAGLLAIRAASGVPLCNYRSYIKYISVMIVFIILIQMLLGPGDRYIIKPLFPYGIPLFGGLGSLKWDGLIVGLIVGCRLISLALLLPMLTMSTEPYQLAMGLAALGLNYRAAYTITAAFNLIPVFREDARGIMEAMKMRGDRAFEGGSALDKFRACPAIAVPLVLGAMRRAQLAGIAMDSRAFGAHKTRTWLAKPVMKGADYLAFAAALVFTALVLFLNHFLK